MHEVFLLTRNLSGLCSSKYGDRPTHSLTQQSTVCIVEFKSSKAAYSRSECLRDSSTCPDWNLLLIAIHYSSSTNEKLPCGVAADLDSFFWFVWLGCECVPACQPPLRAKRTWPSPGEAMRRLHGEPRSVACSLRERPQSSTLTCLGWMGNY